MSILGTDAIWPIAGVTLGFGAVLCVAVLLIFGRKVPTWDVKTGELKGADKEKTEKTA